MSNLLDNFRGLPRNQLIREIRKACEDDLIVLWEDVYYGAIYYPVKAGVIAAQRLGIKPGQVVGYYCDETGGPNSVSLRPVGSALGDLMGCVKQETPPYPDPFAKIEPTS